MVHTVPRERLALIEEIVRADRRLRGRDGTANPPPGAAMIRGYFHGVAEQDLAARTPRELALLCRSHLAFGLRRRPGEALVRVFDPEPARDGLESRSTLVQVVTDDMPFLVDSLRLALDTAGVAVQRLVHPVLSVDRDRGGRLVAAALEPAAGQARRESWQLFEIDRQVGAARLETLAGALRAALADVRAAVADWQPMRERMRAAAAALAPRDGSRAGTGSGNADADPGECRALLHWMESGHFVFLGYRWAPATGSRGARTLGIGRNEAEDVAPAAPAGRTPLLVTKSPRRSTVHRGGHLDEIVVAARDSRGRRTGVHRFLGLWTSGAYVSRPAEIPLVRRKVAAAIDRFGLDPASHDGSAVRAMLETWPRDELFQASVDELAESVRDAVNLYERRRTRLLLRHDPLGRFVAALAFVPRDRYTTEVRRRIERLLCDALGGAAVESDAMVALPAHARLRVLVHGVGAGSRRADPQALEREVAAAATTWPDRLAAALDAGLPATEAARLTARYGNAFPVAFQEDVDPRAATEDVAALESLDDAPSGLRLNLHRPHGRPLSRAHLRILRRGEAVALADLLPVLENFGLRVIAERPYAVATADTPPASIQDLEFERDDGAAIDLDAIEARFIDAFVAVWSGAVDNDGYHRLLVSTPLAFREIEVLRACGRYLLQTGIPFGPASLERSLAAHPEFAATLFALFDARLSPTHADRARRRLEARLAAGLQRRLEQVRNADDDRILRAFLAVVEAVLRTNFHQPPAPDRPRCLALKLDPQAIPGLPLPRPRYEIFVHGARVEGVHLRMGAIARGGIRWSDRRDDFRTEVLGLMKAQNVKNTLIVPVGAKGGFVPRRLPPGGDRDAIQREGVAAYQAFIHALLDVTDNRVDGAIVPPPATHRRDGDDPYLVVAADKGTATFSDLANAISVARGFWLDDAFASGGSAGYDHKKMGITARGAWECVKRHFRELGVDLDAQPFTVAGIGDMSGDVFGNGMLLAEGIRLVAAFNHAHVFLDPDPDPALSLAERRRLFALPRSGWNDYDPARLSRGGGVFPRSAKSIPLSAECRALLGIDAAAASPPEVIRAILRLPVDLLWNGGIGTYVKASSEPQAAAGDRANDAVRVDGRELRARVVGEGGNLGFTQLGRVEFASRGGRIDTDFIDNSGGVNTSDLEVNIKILTAAAERSGRLARSARDRLLRSQTDGIAGLVLRNNYLQGQALSVLELDGARRLPELQHLVRVLERGGELDRAVELLPDDEGFAARRQQGRGLTRPELAVLLSYSKIALNRALSASDAPEDPYLSRELERYFPEPLRKRFPRDVARHPLRREIIATALTNSIVNRMGPTFVTRAQEETRASAAEIARAYTIARESWDLRTQWAAIEALDHRVPAATQYTMLEDTARLLRHATYWLLRRRRGDLAVEPAVSEHREAFAALARGLPEALAGEEAARYEARRLALRAQGVPESLATFVAGTDALDAAPDVAWLARRHRLAVPTAAAAYFTCGARAGLDTLRFSVEGLQVDGAWQVVARAGLRDQARDTQRELADRVLATRRRGSASARVEAWFATRGPALAVWQRRLADVRALERQDFATLSVVLAAARELAA
jgi:glutamate dehydrogenase